MLQAASKLPRGLNRLADGNAVERVKQAGELDAPPKGCRAHSAAPAAAANRVGFKNLAGRRVTLDHVFDEIVPINQVCKKEHRHAPPAILKSK